MEYNFKFLYGYFT